jgi:hypothetical protein
MSARETRGIAKKQLGLVPKKKKQMSFGTS